VSQDSAHNWFIFWFVSLVFTIWLFGESMLLIYLFGDFVLTVCLFCESSAYNLVVWWWAKCSQFALVVWLVLSLF